MSIASPQTRAEFKEHIKMKLGAPVLQINVADEQLDIAINDAFQFFNERNHFNGVERGYLIVDTTQDVVVKTAGDDVTMTYNEFYKSMNEYDVDGVKFKKQNNYITLPDDVVGVVQLMRSRTSMIGGGIVPGGMIYPILLGSLTGDACGNINSTLTTYYAIQEYLALIEWMFFPPRAFNFNQRTHRLSIDGDLSSRGGLLVVECMIKPNPDLFPDLYNDMWLKQFATSLVKAQWGRNLTKYNQVQLPGGIVLNGQQILQDAQTELKEIKDRFAMDYADPPLDLVG